MGKPRLPRGPRTLTREQLAQEQEAEIATLYDRIEKAGQSREWLDRVIHICRTSRGDAGLLDRSRKLADGRLAALEEIDKHAEHVHEQLHRLFAPTSISCSPTKRRACTSLRLPLVAHFLSWRLLRGDLASARLLATSMRTREAFHSGIPAVARTSGGAAELLYEKYTFKHREIALLCEAQELGALPIAEGALKSKTGAVKTAISELRRSRKDRKKSPWVRHVLAPKRRPDHRR